MPVRLRPELPTGVYAAISEIVSRTGAGVREEALRDCARRLRHSDIPHTRPARALAWLLADLAEQGWTLECHRGEVWATPPMAVAAEGESLDEVKSRLRASLLAGRARQLREPAVAEFIRSMEAPRTFKGRRCSVLDVVDDGHGLAAALTEISALPPSERPQALRSVVNPVIQIATASTRCEFTGLPLLEIWRYFRHTWALEYRATPGRTLFLLVRNQGRPNAPVMGIAALANALPQLRVRDLWIGWTPEGLLDRVRRDPGRWPEYKRALVRTLRAARRLIRADDLLDDPAANGPDVEAVLQAIASSAAAARSAGLRERQERLDKGEEVDSLRNLPQLDDGSIDWKRASSAPLFVHKRAGTLANILFAERLLAAAPAEGTLFARECSGDSALARALSIALKEVRKVGLASRLLDVNVCGAVPPYRELLAGKLVALAAASAEVSGWYRERYRKQPSEIASQMAGREVFRDADLCVITTTSLYGVAASQYNRLRVEVASSEGRVVVQWRDLGLTTGFGTVHLSEDTVAALRELTVAKRGGRNVNNVFGEGTSPRLRQVREGLEVLGIESEAVLKHSTPRRVYGLELFPGAAEALLKNEPRAEAPPRFDDLAAAWTERWLSRRITSREVLMGVARQGPESVRAELADRSSPQAELFPEQRALLDALTQPSPTARRKTIMIQQRRAELVQSLYRDSSGCADHHDEETVELLHIKTPVDDVIREVAAGAVVFVTGNPGDGKTHLIKRLQAQLAAAKVDVCLDANERDDADLISMIEAALRKRSGGLVVAINEGTLVSLVGAAGDAAWAAEVRQQLLEPVSYLSRSRAERDEAAPRAGAGSAAKVRVLDLNLRNNLARDVVMGVIKRQLECLAPCAGCPAARCDGQLNAARVAEPRVAERICDLLDAVASKGFHATMRDLHAFVSYMLFGGARCDDIKATAERAERPYWECAFEGGEGPLFDAVRSFDPAGQPLPFLDDTLWRGADLSGDWFVPFQAPPAQGDLQDRRSRFLSRKRRALFEHVRGDGILRAAGTQVDRLFSELVERRKGARDLVRLLNRFFDRDERNSDTLYLWVAHRYDARPNRFAVSATSVPTTQLEVLVPELKADLSRAFPGYKPDHVLLNLKGRPPVDGLRVDRALIGALTAAEQGLPAVFRRGEPEARISAFFDRLTRATAADAAHGPIDVRFVDMNTGSNFHLSVDVAGSRYVRS